jgi:hypothetical protein
VPGETRFITDNLERFARQHKKKVEAEREKLNRLCSVGIVPLPLYRQAGKIPNPEETT